MMNSIANASDLASLNALVRGLYSLQKLRIQAGNRVIATVKVNLGQEAGMSEEEITPEAKKILKDLRDAHQKITDAVPSMLKLRRDFKPEGYITGYAQYCLISEYIRMEQVEEEHEKHIKVLVEQFPIWRDFLKAVPGCGPQLAAIIICRLDPHKSKYASSMWKFAGLDVGPDGRGRGRYKEHLVPKSYTNAKGDTTETVGITFDPFLKTKLLGVLGPCMLKAAAITKKGTLKYEEAYRGYRNRLNNHPAHKDKTDKHKHNMANRYMIKRFLVDLYTKWRALEGLEVWPEYGEAKLGLVHDQDREVRTLYPHQQAAMEAMKGSPSSTLNMPASKT